MVVVKVNKTIFETRKKKVNKKNEKVLMKVTIDGRHNIQLKFQYTIFHHNKFTLWCVFPNI